MFGSIWREELSSPTYIKPGKAVYKIIGAILLDDFTVVDAGLVLEGHENVVAP